MVSSEKWFTIGEAINSPIFDILGMYVYHENGKTVTFNYYVIKQN